MLYHCLSVCLSLNYGFTPLTRQRYWYRPYATAANRTSMAYTPIPVPVESVGAAASLEAGAGALGAGSPGWIKGEKS